MNMFSHREFHPRPQGLGMLSVVGAESVICRLALWAWLMLAIPPALISLFIMLLL